MKTNIYTYEELQSVHERFESVQLLQFSVDYFQNLENGIEVEKIQNPDTWCSSRIDAALRYYIMDEPLSLVEKTIRYAVKWQAYALENERNSDPRYLKSNFYDGLQYVKYLRLLSLSVLLGYDKKDMKILEEVVHVIKGKDILLDTLLSAMTGCEVSEDVMTTNVYPKLVEIIKEKDKSVAEDMIIDFMAKHWWKNTGKYGFRDNTNIFTYTGAFAFETAAIAKIKGLDMSKFEGLKYFPIDMAYYKTSKEGTVEVVCDRMYERTYSNNGYTIKFNTNLEAGRDFENGKLIGYDFSNMKLNNVCFAGSDLTSAKFYNTELINCDFEGANMFGVDIQNTRIIGCNFKDLEAQRISLHKSELSNSMFKDAVLLEGGMTLSKVELCTFDNCNMLYLDLSGTDFQKNELIDSGFAGIERDLEDTKYIDNSFVRTDIENTKFTSEEKKQNKFD